MGDTAVAAPRLDSCGCTVKRLRVSDRSAQAQPVGRLICSNVAGTVQMLWHCTQLGFDTVGWLTKHGLASRQAVQMAQAPQHPQAHWQRAGPAGQHRHPHHAPRPHPYAGVQHPQHRYHAPHPQLTEAQRQQQLQQQEEERRRKQREADEAAERKRAEDERKRAEAQRIKAEKEAEAARIKAEKEAEKERKRREKEEAAQRRREEAEAKRKLREQQRQEVRVHAGDSYGEPCHDRNRVLQGSCPQRQIVHGALCMFKLTSTVM